MCRDGVGEHTKHIQRMYEALFTMRYVFHNKQSYSLHQSLNENQQASPKQTTLEQKCAACKQTNCREF